MLLLWSDLDMKAGKLTVRKEIQKGGNRERQPRPRDMERAWQRAGVGRDAWEGQPYKAFRKGFKSELLKNPLIREDAIHRLQGHKLSNGNASARYMTDDALGLPEAEKAIPKLGTVSSNVVPLPSAPTAHQTADATT